MKPFFYCGRQVGILKPDGTFITFRNHKHYFRKFAGLGMSFKVLHELRNLGCNKIKIVFEEEPGKRVLLEASPDLFLERGLVYLDGGDAQRILPLSVLAQLPLGGSF